MQRTTSTIVSAISGMRLTDFTSASSRFFIVEGAGGLLVPLSEHEVLAGGLARAVEIGVIDEVVEPERTRSTLARAIVDAPQVRGQHGNIPL